MVDSQHVLGAALRPAPWGAATRPGSARLLLAGAGGALGAQVLHGLAASGLFAHTDVLTTERITMALPQVGTAAAGAPQWLPDWPLPPHRFDTAVVMFEPPVSFNGRERAFFTPTPAQLPALAAWLKRCGVHTLVIVVPHAPGQLPQALKRGLASLGEQAVASLGFDRVLLIRSAASAHDAEPAPTRLPEKLARWMLSISSYMIAAHEQPVRPERVAQFIEAALRVLPVGTFVASSDLLHRASPAGKSAGAGSLTMTQLVHDWLADKAISALAADAPPA